MPQEIRLKNFEIAQTYHNDICNETFGIPSALRNTTGISKNRLVFANTELKTVGETATDNVTVGYAGTAGATGGFVGVCIDGHTETEFNAGLLPGTNRDYNCTVLLLGVALVEVAPAAIIALGSAVLSDANGLAAAAGTATNCVALDAATGAGTAANPEFIRVLVR